MSRFGVQGTTRVAILLQCGALLPLPNTALHPSYQSRRAKEEIEMLGVNINKNLTASKFFMCLASFIWRPVDVRHTISQRWDPPWSLPYMIAMSSIESETFGKGQRQSKTTDSEETDARATCNTPATATTSGFFCVVRDAWCSQATTPHLARHWSSQTPTCALQYQDWS